MFCVLIIFYIYQTIQSFLINSNLYPPSFANVFSITVKIRQFPVSFFDTYFDLSGVHVALHNSLHSILIINRSSRSHSVYKKHFNNRKRDGIARVVIYVNKIENRIMFKIKTRYYLELFTPETMKLLGSTKSKITKNQSGKDVPHLEITEEVIVYYNIVNNIDI